MTQGNADDASLCIVVRGFGVRLPLDEVVTVSPAYGVTGDDRGDPGVTVRYEIRTLGFPFVTLSDDVECSGEHSG